MPGATFTFRVDDELKTQFTNAAKAHDRNGAQLLRDFMREYVRRQDEMVAHDAWFRRQVQTGIESADVGDVISAEEVEAEATAWRAEVQRKLASTGS